MTRTMIEETSHIKLRAATLIFLSMAIAGCAATRPTIPDTCGGLEPVPLTRAVHPPEFFRKRSDARKVIVFVHGITGDGEKTWKNVNGTFWPALIERDPALADFDIYLYGYASTFFGRCARIPDLAKELEMRLAEALEPYQQVVFVAHSQGGLVVRQALLGANTDVVSKTKLLVFYGTPTGGSPVADRVSSLTECVDDLRQLEHNSFLKDQAYEWQRSPLRNIPLYCAAESDARLVGTASATYQCSESQAIGWSHTELVRPACENDYRHVFLRRAVSGLRAASRSEADLPEDDAAATFAKRYREVEEERYVLSFWNGFGSGSPANRKLLSELMVERAVRRMAVFEAALRRPELARKFITQPEAVLRAVVGSDVRILDELPSIVRSASAQRNAGGDIETAIRKAADVLEMSDRDQLMLIPSSGQAVMLPPDASAEVREEIVEYFLADVEAPAAVLSKLRTALTDGDAQARDRHIRELRNAVNELSPKAKLQLQRSYADGFVRLPHWYRPDDSRGKACEIAWAIGAGDVLAAVVAERYAENHISHRPELLDMPCLADDALKRSTDIALERIARAGAVGPHGHIASDDERVLITALSNLPAPDAEGFARRLDPVTHRRLLMIYLQRRDASPQLWKTAFERVRCVRGTLDRSLIAGIAHLRDAEALQFWTTIVQCQTSNLFRDWSEIVDFGHAVALRVPTDHRGAIFHDILVALQSSWTGVLSLDHVEKLRVIAREVSDQAIYDERHYLLYFLQDARALQRVVTHQIITILTERVPRLLKREQDFLSQVAEAALPKPLAAYEIDRAKDFFRIFHEDDRSEVVRTFLSNGPRVEISDDLVEDEAYAILMGGPIAPGREQAVLSRASYSPRLVDAVINVLKDFNGLSTEEENRRVGLLKVLRGALRAEAIRQAEKRASVAAPSWASYRFLNALNCAAAEADSAVMRMRRDAFDALTRSQDVREIYSAASLLTDCGLFELPPSDTEILHDAFTRAIARTRSFGDLHLLVRACQLVCTRLPDEAIWIRLAALLQHDESRGQDVTAVAIVNVIEPPSRAAVKALMVTPDIPRAVLEVVLRKVSEMAGTPLRTWWDLMRWVADDRVST